VKASVSTARGNQVTQEKHADLVAIAVVPAGHGCNIVKDGEWWERVKK
jgi:hypothetical protein